MTLSKREIDNLGDVIRSEGSDVTVNTLLFLQEYRISYKEPLSDTFNLLCKLVNRVHGASIVTFRIKRIESIISKTIRFPEMRFSRMWDIGGCRCIFRIEKDIYKLRDFINKDPNLAIVKENDYIQNPKPDGYKSLHLYIKCNNNERLIEVQIRSKQLHNWATLVEITDLLFDTKLKELGNNKELSYFHKLLSDSENLNNFQKIELVDILNKYDYFERLSSVFARNYLSVRQQWLIQENKINHKYFLIESYKDKIPNINSFQNFQEAENHYFELYKSSENANIILTHLKSGTYSQISLAYSNYILTFHSFLFECLTIIENLIEETLEKKDYFKFKKYLKLYSNLLFSLQYNFIKEINEASPHIEKNTKSNSKNKRTNEWYNDLEALRDKIVERANNFGLKLRNTPKSFFYKFLFEREIKNVEKKHSKKLDKVISESNNIKF